MPRRFYGDDFLLALSLARTEAHTGKSSKEDDVPTLNEALISTTFGNRPKTSISSKYYTCNNCSGKELLPINTSAVGQTVKVVRFTIPNLQVQQLQGTTQSF